MLVVDVQCVSQPFNRKSSSWDITVSQVASSAVLKSRRRIRDVSGAVEKTPVVMLDDWFCFEFVRFFDKISFCFLRISARGSRYKLRKVRVWVNAWDLCPTNKSRCPLVELPIQISASVLMHPDANPS